MDEPWSAERTMTFWMYIVGLACLNGEQDSGSMARTQAAVDGTSRRVSIVETSSGKLLITDGSGGNVGGEVCLSELNPSHCAGNTELGNPCLLFGTDIQADGKVLMTYALRDPSTPVAPGAISLVNPTHPPTVEWTIDALDLSPAMQAQERIDCIADPATPECQLYGAHNTWIQEDGTLLVADTSNSRILWLHPPDNGSSARVAHVLSKSHPQWGTERYPNQVQHLDIDGEPHLMITFKARIKAGNELVDEGRIVLWNISDIAVPTRVWAFPQEGGLAAVHQGWVEDTPMGQLLLYAHSGGAVDETIPERYGSIGFAAFQGADPPTYLMDGILPSPGLGFTREVEWDEENQSLLVVDSGCENSQDDCDRPGRILLVELPERVNSNKMGTFTPGHEHQTFVEMKLRNNLLERSLRFPFEADPLEEGELVNIGLCDQTVTAF